MKNKFAPVLALLLILVCASAVQAEKVFEYPQTRAGELAKNYIQALNSGNVDTLKEFYASFYAEASLAKRPPAARAERAIALHGQVGTLVPAVVTDQSDSTLTITALAEKINTWLTCKFSLEGQAPRKLASVMMIPGSPPQQVKTAVRDWKNLTDLLSQVCQDEGIPAIAAAVVQDGQITDMAAAGVRQADTKDEVQIDDRFHLGSITKSITATMIGRLVEEGKLAWNNTIAQAFDDLDVRKEYRNVTLEQLLQHRGGLPGYTNMEEDEAARLESLPGTPTEQRAAFAAEVLGSEPVAVPGTEMNYSNAGYAVAGLMAERAAGMEWAELVTRYVLTPAGMKHTGFGWPATEKRPNQPKGHFQDGGNLRAQAVEEYPLGEFLAPAGDMNASIEDLAHYAILHLDGLGGRDGLIKAGTIQRLHTPLPSGTDDIRYAGGWMIVERDGLGTVHTHSGSTGTFFATIELYPSKNRAIVVATNTGGGAGTIEEIIQAITERMQSDTK